MEESKKKTSSRTIEESDEGSNSKKARIDPQNKELNQLPLELQFAIPFLPCGSLAAIAALSKAGRKAALESYTLRLHTPFPVAKLQLTTDSPPTVFSSETSSNVAPPYYQKMNPWLHHSGAEETKGWGNYGRNHKFRPYLLDEQIHQSNDSATATWDLEWLADGLQKQSATLHWPTELQQISKNNIRIAHRSLLPGTTGKLSLLIVAMVKSFVGDNNNDGINHGYDSEDAFTRKELWGILYNDILIQAEDQSSIPEFHPSIATRILEPLHGEWLGIYDYVEFGSTCRSGNGKVFATVTHLPNIEFDNEDEQACVTVYDITPSSDIVPRHKITVETWNSISDYSGLTLSLSTGGEILTVRNNEKYDEEGALLVYDIRADQHNDPPKKIFEIEGGCGRRGHAFFTPDNDFFLGPWSSSEFWMKKLFERKDLNSFSRQMIVLTEE
ncbi:expressed unknown protein [Seminavis robusta]|uniref:Uncharacterized protein n=1 Tax=Seminavis robusta TaxID=568900 RepID=A0A9N8DQZ7_9STRA|nr:expressed unknown protein [Seminavis robusta]|eukprot:Sro293_g109910.1 n/a (442) ;mRNA; f:37733-39058